MKKEKYGKLLDFLREVSPDEVVHIGAATSFLYVGKVSEAYEDIPELSKELYSEKVESLKRNIADMERLMESAPKRNKQKLYDYSVEMSKYIKNIQKSYRKIKECQKDIKDYQELENRNIIDVYSRIQNDGICIIIEGSERGYYWDIEEYKSRKIRRQYD